MPPSHKREASTRLNPRFLFTSFWTSRGGQSRQFSSSIVTPAKAGASVVRFALGSRFRGNDVMGRGNDARGCGNGGELHLASPPQQTHSGVIFHRHPRGRNATPSPSIVTPAAGAQLHHLPSSPPRQERNSITFHRHPRGRSATPSPFTVTPAAGAQLHHLPSSPPRQERNSITFHRHPRGSGGPVWCDLLWVPAFAGMTCGRAGVTHGRAGVTHGRAGVTRGRAGVTYGEVRMTPDKAGTMAKGERVPAIP